MPKAGIEMRQKSEWTEAISKTEGSSLTLSDNAPAHYIFW